MNSPELPARSKAPAIARAAAILRLLGRSDTALGLQPIARELGLVPSTCLYVLRALVEEELVSFDPVTKRYAPGSGLLTLARGYLRRDPVPELAQPAIERLSRRFDVTAMAVEVHGIDHIVALGVAQGSGNFRLSTDVGSRFPALISATGRCIAAFGGHSHKDLATRFEKLRWDMPPTLAEWLEQVEITRQRGYGIDEGQYIAGVSVLAAPVRRSGEVPSHALVTLGLSRDLSPNLAQLADALVQEARALSDAG